MKITNDNGILILLQRPMEGQRCQTKQFEGEGYNSSVVYKNGYFESYSEHTNRVEITRWMVDLWLPAEEII